MKKLTLTFLLQLVVVIGMSQTFQNSYNTVLKYNRLTEKYTIKEVESRVYYNWNKSNVHLLITDEEQINITQLTEVEEFPEYQQCIVDIEGESFLMCYFKNGTLSFINEFKILSFYLK